MWRLGGLRNDSGAVASQARRIGQPSRAGPSQAGRPGHPQKVRFSFETDVQRLPMELRLCQIIKKSMLDISLESLSKMYLQIFCWESKRGPNFMIFWSWAKLVTGAIWVKIPAGSITYRVSPLLCKLCVSSCVTLRRLAALVCRLGRLRHDFGASRAGPSQASQPGHHSQPGHSTELQIFF